MTEKDTLSKFGTNFQTKTLSCLVSDKQFAERMMDILDPQYYDQKANQWVCKKIRQYWNKYRDTATMDFFKTELSKENDEEARKSKIRTLRQVFKGTGASDLEYVKDEFLEFSKNQAMKVAILDSVDLMKLGNYDAIRSKIDDALNAGTDKSVGHIYTRDFDDRMKDSARNTVPTPFEVLNEAMDGGLGKGELGSFVGASGAGKTWMLAALGLAGLKHGKMVAHYTLELSEEQTGLRYDSLLSHKSPTDVKKDKERVRKLVEKIKSNGAELAIQEWPARTASVQSIRSHVSRLELLHRKPDMILVDYADLLRTTNGNSYDGNSYERAGQIYVELRALASELQLPIWTVSQANREGNSSDIIGAELIADSYQKVMHCDFMASISRTADDKNMNTGRIHLIKNRFGPDGMTYPSVFDPENGRIRVFENNSQQSDEMMRDMEVRRQQNEDRRIGQLANEFLNNGGKLKGNGQSISA